MVDLNVDDIVCFNRPRDDHDALLLQLVVTAERAFFPDPDTTLLKLRQLGEALAQDIASRLGIQVEGRTTQLGLLRKLKESPPVIAQ